MRLNRARIKNFKLLKDLEIEFSIDPDKPLTLIRAENGSGKTSLLAALRWGMYGYEGQARALGKVRLASAASPPGIPVEVEVELDFEQYDGEANKYVRYRIIRTVIETPQPDDRFEREAERLQMFRAEGTGWYSIGEGAQGIVSRFVPLRLANVFFTDGDDVQRFVSNRVGQRERQAAVHDAVKQLLGLEELDTVVKDLDELCKKLRGEIAQEVGGELKDIEQELALRRDSLEQRATVLAEEIETRGNIERYISDAERELRGMGDVGALDSLNQRIDGLERDIEDLNRRIIDTYAGARKEIFRGQQLSWDLMAPQLSRGISSLKALDSRGIIPGTSVEVLRDRLSIHECICGEKLTEGDRRWNAIASLIEAQAQHAPERLKQTELWHRARHEVESQAMIRAEYGSAGDQLKRILRDVTRLKETVSGKARELQDARTRREGIDQERVAVVTERLRKLRADELRTSEAIGRLQLEVENLSVAVTEWEDRFQEVERRASSAVTVRARNNAASDLLSLTSRILAVLKNEWIGRVSTKMNELFLEIVGADPDHVGGVFRRVYISEKFDIVVESADGRTLDFDQEVNGASQRALTLSFIWALMEVTGREAPRVIDTPLGMVSGGVRTRMVELITQSGPTNRQVVLLMTRAEIRDVEQLLEERMGVALTLSCSKDYPTDLITNWASDNPEVRRCDCNHRQFCAVCARKGDAHFGLQERGAV